MSNLQTLVKGDIAIFENAIKVAGGNKTLAKENLTKAIFNFARVISNQIFKNGLKVNPEYAVIENVSNGLESERVAIIVQAGNCFAINKEGVFIASLKVKSMSSKSLKKKISLVCQVNKLDFCTG